jgi:hypothetical protein
VFYPSNFPKKVLARIADIFYDDVRCGFFHENMARQRIQFTQESYFGAFNANFPRVKGKPNINGQITGIVINPGRLLDEVEAHSKEYIGKLRDKNNTRLRRNFKRACAILWPAPSGPPLEFGALENPLV